ncbi:MAG TPA: hypothetical protein VL651_04680 [Bacteroidia bacterium]|jgi:hypothetical protein|nr:hypothetical protein [Bacteroidia bacterium]
MKKFNQNFFFIIFVLLCVLVLFSFVSAVDYDERGGTDLSFLNEIFKILSFPSLTLFSSVFGHSQTGFVTGLLLNISIYSFLAERIYTFIKLKRSNRKNSIEE